MFWAPCSSRGGEVGWIRVGGGWRCLHTHAHACMCTHTHAHIINMIISCKWTPPWGNPWEFPMMSYTCACVCVCVCVHACGCVWGHPVTTPYPHPPTPTPQRGTPGISQNSIALELIEIFQFLLKIWNLWRLPHPWVGVWFGGWVGWWVGSAQITKNFKIVDWIKIIQFCLKIYHL